MAERIKDIPITLSAVEVRALLDGRKTQARVIIKKAAALNALSVFGPSFLLLPGNVDLVRYAVGDRLWVRESWQTGMTGNGPQIAYAATPDFAAIDAWDGPDEGRGPSFNYDRCPGAVWHHWLGDVLGANGPWRPSTHMQRWASRITLVVEDVRVQRLQDITPRDCADEGCQLARWVREDAGQPPPMMDIGVEAEGRALVRAYRDLWNDLHGADAWDGNPYVVALTFSVIRANVDSLKAQAHGGMHG